MVSDCDDYRPAIRPEGEDADRVTFEREGRYEQSVFGGGAQDIERAILTDTYINTRVIGKRVMSVATVRGDLGAGSLQAMTFRFEGGGELKIEGIGMQVQVSE